MYQQRESAILSMLAMLCSGSRPMSSRYIQWPTEEEGASDLPIFTRPEIAASEGDRASARTCLQRGVKPGHDLHRRVHAYHLSRVEREVRYGAVRGEPQVRDASRRTMLEMKSTHPSTFRSFTTSKNHR